MRTEDQRNEEVKCEDLSHVFADYVNGDLPDDEAGGIRRHLDSCPACRAEVEGLGTVWHALGELREEEPSTALASRFYTMLEAYQDRRFERGRGKRFAEWLESWWPRRPTTQAALAAASLLLGLVIGARFTAGGGELTVLQSEVASLHRLVSLSLLQQESASARLEGVSYSRRSAADDEVLSALVTVLNEDDNVSVRVAAVDALARFAARPSVADDLRSSLPRQSSPLVQVALVDLLLELNGPESARTIRELYEDEGLDETVRAHIVEKLSDLKV